MDISHMLRVDLPRQPPLGLLRERERALSPLLACPPLPPEGNSPFLVGSGKLLTHVQL